MTKRGGLGRGLAALIPTAPPPQPEQPAPERPTVVPAPAPEAPAGDGGAAESPAPRAGAPPEDAGGGPGAQLPEVAVDDIAPNPKQPRQVFDDEALEELTHSVREFGLLQPIVVREKPDGGYELIMGERRLRAAKAAALDTVPAIVRDTTDDALLRDALL